jgi:hypothetical protein
MEDDLKEINGRRPQKNKKTTEKTISILKNQP